MTTLTAETLQVRGEGARRYMFSPQFVLGFSSPSGEVLPDRESFFTHCCRHLLPAVCCQGVVCWNFQDVRLPSLHCKTGLAVLRQRNWTVGGGAVGEQKEATGLQCEVGSEFTPGCQGRWLGGQSVNGQGWLRLGQIGISSSNRPGQHTAFSVMSLAV